MGVRGHTFCCLHSVHAGFRSRRGLLDLYQEKKVEISADIPRTTCIIDTNLYRAYIIMLTYLGGLWEAFWLVEIGDCHEDVRGVIGSASRARPSSQ